jgi:hypothetical protein
LAGEIKSALKRPRKWLRQYAKTDNVTVSCVNPKGRHLIPDAFTESVIAPNLASRHQMSEKSDNITSLLSGHNVRIQAFAQTLANQVTYHPQIVIFQRAFLNYRSTGVHSKIIGVKDLIHFQSPWFSIREDTPKRKFRSPRSFARRMPHHGLQRAPDKRCGIAVG